VERVRGRAGAVESPIGWMPRHRDIDWTGMEDYPKEEFKKIMAVDREQWKKEILAHEELFATMYDRLPKEFLFMRELLLSALWRSPAKWESRAERYDD
jgi:phosphoenolpyruvate carboxykinase (GTP)